MRKSRFHGVFSGTAFALGVLGLLLTVDCWLIKQTISTTIETTAFRPLRLVVDFVLYALATQDTLSRFGLL